METKLWSANSEKLGSVAWAMRMATDLHTAGLMGPEMPRVP
ncbi:MAG: hypothetical protein WBE13_05980 [Candidatus Acidiferrum sp.]